MSDWREQAACLKHDAELWFPSSQADPRIRDAKAICRTCPVIAQCATFAVNERYGIWAATTEWERSNAKRRERRGVGTGPHGSAKALRAHLDAGEEPCAQCQKGARQREASKLRKRELRARNIAASGGERLPAKIRDNCGTPAGYSTHRRRFEEVCEPCRRADNVRRNELEVQRIERARRVAS